MLGACEFLRVGDYGALLGLEPLLFGVIGTGLRRTNALNRY